MRSFFSFSLSFTSSKIQERKKTNKSEKERERLLCSPDDETHKTKKKANTITIIECEINFHETKSLAVFIKREVKCIDMKNWNKIAFTERNKKTNNKNDGMLDNSFGGLVAFVFLLLFAAVSPCLNFENRKTSFYFSIVLIETKNNMRGHITYRVHTANSPEGFWDSARDKRNKKEVEIGLLLNGKILCLYWRNLVHDFGVLLVK